MLTFLPFFYLKAPFLHIFAFRVLQKFMLIMFCEQVGWGIEEVIIHSLFGTIRTWHAEST